MGETIDRFIRRVGASVLFVGYVPMIPGTAGAALTAAIIWFGRDWLSPLYGPAGAGLFWVVGLCLTGLSIVLSNRAKEVFGRPDPGPVVIDEVVGQFITFFMVPISLRTVILGFVLFRFFDIIKPYPIHAFEELDEGLGITMDDVAAGVCANISLLTLLWMYHGIKAYF